MALPAPDFTKKQDGGETAGHFQQILSEGYLEWKGLKRENQ